jgi:lipopolysaccharide/colanic/teichoic acid biosynthesis glycosyltransferase
VDSGRADIVKRAFDLIVSLAALALASPVIALIALAVRLRLGTPVLFRQRRPGLHGAPFIIYKFRTMTDHRGPDGEQLPDEQRLTRFGRFLRASSLDELPELLNVVRGEMSLVGPRPLLMEYVERYSPRQARRHDVRPGLTGLAQVSGRNATTWTERLELDVWYVEHRNLSLDLRIIGRTMKAVLRREGVSADGHATMPTFMGDQTVNATDEPARHQS